MIRKRKILFIGDTEGKLPEIKKLISKFPNYFYIFLGDLQDRGNYSKETIEFLMGLTKEEKALVLFGNHEELFLNFIANDFSNHWYDFLFNGGINTLISYNKNNSKIIKKASLRILSLFEDYFLTEEFIRNEKDISKSLFYKEHKKELKELISIINQTKLNIPKNYIQFIKNLPRVAKGTNWIASHAPIKKELSKEFINSSEFLWNRELYFNHDFHHIFGHNGFKMKKLNKNNKLLICVDDSHNYNLIAFNWFTKKFVK